MEPTWSESDVLAERFKISGKNAQTLINLLDSGATVPFIARYRREHTGGVDAACLRQFQQAHEELQTIKAKINSVAAVIEKSGQLTDSLKTSLCSAQTMTEVEHLYAPHKPGSKRSLAERAKSLGLEPMAFKVLNGSESIDWSVKVEESKDLHSVSDMQMGVQNIIADIVAKDKDTLELSRQIVQQGVIVVSSSKSRSAEKMMAETNSSTKSGCKSAASSSSSGAKLNIDPMKFANYFEFCQNAARIKPHQVMALNRGEEAKCLTVKVSVPEEVKNRMVIACEKKWLNLAQPREHHKIIMAGIADGYSRLIEPHMTRQQWSELTRQAEVASVEVFAANLRNLLLTPPVRGRVVLGLDPGFSHGCKFAVVSPQGDVLATGVAYLHSSSNEEREVGKLASAMRASGCELVALGNGVACRETETVLSTYIARGSFRPLNVAYSIVSESGASVYSASEQADKDLPDLDIATRGAVSIARRLQDPLAELVKIEPKHIGVGMYQHDVKESRLTAALDGVVEECVSFVGVDVNTCSEVVLRRVAGLSAATARNIVSHRAANGPFISREQLRQVKGVGAKTFEQCAGFVRVLPETRSGNGGVGVKDEEAGRAGKIEDKAEVVKGSSAAGSKRKKSQVKLGASKKMKAAAVALPDDLDTTSVHPESYALARSVVNLLSGDVVLGTSAFRQQLLQLVERRGLAVLAQQFSVTEAVLQTVVDSLSELRSDDFRDKFDKPLFRQKVLSLTEVKIGDMLTGQVRNVTHFGAFVDVGVGVDALLHVSQMKGVRPQLDRDLVLGDKVKVTVCSIDLARKRVGVSFTSCITS